jgi:hypothetical protein
VPFYFEVGTRNRVVPGTSPDITTVYNLADRGNGNPTQASAPLRPHWINVNGKPALDFSNEALTSPTMSPAMYAAGQVGCTVGVVARWDAISTFATIIDVSSGTTNQGMHFRSSATDTIRLSVNAGGSNTNHSVSFSSTDFHYFLCLYDGAEISIESDGVAVGSPTAKTGTMSYEGVQVDIGQAANGGARLDGAVRAGFVYPGIPTAAQKTALLEWGSRMKP